MTDKTSIGFGHPSTLGAKPFRPVSIIMVDLTTGVVEAPRPFDDVEAIAAAYGLTDCGGIGPEIEQFRTDETVYACFDAFYDDQPDRKGLIFAHSLRFLVKRTVPVEIVEHCMTKEEAFDLVLTGRAGTFPVKGDGNRQERRKRSALG